jgi:hypothetical protein
MSKLIINNTDIVIRPSSVDTFLQCSYQWAKVFLEGVNTIPGNRAAIGTGIHKGAEVMWSDAIKTGKKDTNLTMITDAAVQAYEEEFAKGVQLDDGESKSGSVDEVVAGSRAFVSDIAMFTPIPKAVEIRATIEISGHPIVKAVSGTIDYLGKDNISDLKTSKRKPTPANYTTQQSIYRMLAESEGHAVNYNTIQGVVLKASPEGLIMPIETNVPQAKQIVNNMLDVLEIAVQDKVPLETLFRGNPKYYLCSNKYCSLYNTCPYVKGEEPRAAL